MLLTAEQVLANLAAEKDSRAFARGLWGAIQITGQLGCEDVEKAIAARDAEIAEEARREEREAWTCVVRDQHGAVALMLTEPAVAMFRVNRSKVRP